MPVLTVMPGGDLCVNPGVYQRPLLAGTTSYPSYGGIPAGHAQPIVAPAQVQTQPYGPAPTYVQQTQTMPVQVGYMKSEEPSAPAAYTIVTATAVDTYV
jgi:hypothetical protein